MKKKKDGRFRTSIGGQALIEGIMMRGPRKQAIVVSTKDGLVEKVEELKLIKDRYPILGWPLIRGVVNFGGSMSGGVRALMYSADCAMDAEDAVTDTKQSKFDLWVERKLRNETVEKFIMAVTMVIGIAFSIGLFILLPTILAGLSGSFITSPVLKNLLEGAIRIVIFLAYLILATRSKGIRRIFEYHGGEHKTIHCYEKCLELTVENVRPQPRQHPRCGTSFLFVVMIVSILIFSVVSWSNPFVRMALRIALLPVVIAISYEINRFVGRHDNAFTRFLSAPGRALQILTVYEPDDNMIEVAIRALSLVIPEKTGEDKW